MRHSSKWVVMCLVLIISIGFIGSLPAREDASGSVYGAAQGGLRSFLEAIPEGMNSVYGFPSDFDINRAELGAPFRVHFINPDDIINYTAGVDLAPMIHPLEQWLFPVVYDGKYCAILTVENMGGVWEAVALGNPRLAGQLKYVDVNLDKQSAGELKFIRVYQAQADFVSVYSDGQTKLAPLPTAARILSGSAGFRGIYTLHDPSEIFPELVEPILNNLTNF